MSTTPGLPRIAVPAVVSLSVVLVTGAVLGATLAGQLPWPAAVATVVATGAVIGLIVRLLIQSFRRFARVSRRQQELAARTDPVTGLPNRMALEESLVAACARQNSIVTVLLLDVDRFREVNDSFGHRSGDGLLAVLAGRLREVSGPDLVIGRMGGDEFAAVIQGPLGRARVEQIRASLAGAALLLGGSRIDVTVSAGTAAGVGGDVSAEVLLQRADLAMYAAKRQYLHGGGYAEWEPAMGQQTVERLAMLSDLRTAVEDDEIEVYVQPAVALPEGRVAGVEALVRWNHPEHGLLGPDAFVPLAERCDIIHTLTAATLNRSVAAAARWQRAGRDLSVSVNVSPRDLRAELPALIRDVLARHGLDPSRLVIELTETCLPSSMELAARVLRQVVDLGVRVSVDDFGTGFATLAWLRRLSFTGLKIDRTFVGDLVREPGARELVRHCIALGHGLGMTVTAEGVETEEQERVLREFGCDYAQGYRHAAPMPLAEFDAWLERQEDDRELLSGAAVLTA